MRSGLRKRLSEEGNLEWKRIIERNLAGEGLNLLRRGTGRGKLGHAFAMATPLRKVPSKDQDTGNIEI